MSSAANYEYYKKHKICVNCGQDDAVKNHTLCLFCMIKNRERSKKYQREHREERREKNRIRGKERYHKLKEQGICTSCGKRKAKYNKTKCEYCGAKEREIKRKKYLLTAYATRNMAEIRV